MAVYVSTGAFRSQTLEDIVHRAESMELTHVELSSSCTPLPDFDQFVPRLKASSLQFSIHNYFPPPMESFVLNLGSLDPITLRRSRDHVRYCLDLTAELGGTYYSVHSAFLLAMTSDMLGKPQVQAAYATPSRLWNREAVRATFMESLVLLSQEGAARGLEVYIENNVVSPRQVTRNGQHPFLMVTAGEIEALFRELNISNLGLLLDVAHLRISATALGFDPEQFMVRVQPWVRAVHLSDNDGIEDSNMSLTDQSWFWPLLGPSANCDMTLEAYKLDDLDIVRQVRLVERKLRGC